MIITDRERLVDILWWCNKIDNNPLGWSAEQIIEEIRKIATFELSDDSSSAFVQMDVQCKSEYCSQFDIVKKVRCPVENGLVLWPNVYCFECDIVPAFMERPQKIQG